MLGFMRIEYIIDRMVKQKCEKTDKLRVLREIEIA